jgi:hypothetical protein
MAEAKDVTEFVRGNLCHVSWIFIENSAAVPAIVNNEVSFKNLVEGSPVNDFRSSIAEIASDGKDTAAAVSRMRWVINLVVGITERNGIHVIILQPRS